MQAAINQFKIEKLIAEAKKNGCRYIAINRGTNQWSYSTSRKDIDTAHHRFYSHPEKGHPSRALVMGNCQFSQLRSMGVITLIEIIKNKQQ